MYQAVTENCIAELVDTFYGKVRDDQLLGPIFSRTIGTDWEPHLEKMKAFWASVLLASRTYKGNPMIAHLQLPHLIPQHFERWLQLWREAASSLCSQTVAALFVRRAEMIAERFLQAISAYHDAAYREIAATPRKIL